MANYNAFSRTNYFRVTDEEKLREIVDLICCEDDVELWQCGDFFAFGAYGMITQIYNEETEDVESIFPKLQSILPDNEVAVIVEVGHEKLRYLIGCAWIVTNKKVKFIDLSSEINKQMPLESGKNFDW